MPACSGTTNFTGKPDLLRGRSKNFSWGGCVTVICVLCAFGATPIWDVHGFSSTPVHVCLLSDSSIYVLRLAAEVPSLGNCDMVCMYFHIQCRCYCSGGVF